jgi:hypothetical protein
VKVTTLGRMKRDDRPGVPGHTPPPTCHARDSILPKQTVSAATLMRGNHPSPLNVYSRSAMSDVYFAESGN